MRISDWSSDVCSSDLAPPPGHPTSATWWGSGLAPSHPSNRRTALRAFIFPGQGSQAVGMGKALAEASAAAREIFQETDEALAQNLFRLDRKSTRLNSSH